MPRTRHRTLVAALGVAVLLSTQGGSPHDAAARVYQDPAPRRADPTTNPANYLESWSAWFERCALLGSQPEEALRRVGIRVRVLGRGQFRIEYSQGLDDRGRAAIVRCVQSEARRALRAATGPRFSEGTFLFRPFHALDLPMEPPPGPAARVLSADEADSLVAALTALAGDSARREQLAAIEGERTAVPTSHARAVLGAFQAPDARAGGALCRVVFGPNARQAVEASIPRSERRRFRALVRGACGTSLAPH